MLIPNCILSIRVLRKASCEDFAVIQEDDFRLLRAIVRHALRHNNARARLNDAQHFILGGRGDVRALAINCQTVDLLHVAVDDFEDVAAVEWRV